jgi:hypothetical protein
VPSDAIKVCSALQQALLKLRASGSDGFEGFIRDAFNEATGLSTRIQKSSMQGGVDTLSDTSSEQIAIGIEAKRYQETTTLPLDELKSKLFDAATRSGSPIELWILAVSKEVSADDAGALRKIGDDLGLGVLVLDWRSNSDFFARLPFLVALAPNTVERRLGRKIASAIQHVADHPEFEARRNAFLREVQHPDLGRVFAAGAVRSRIGQTLQTRANSRSRLQNNVDLGAPGCIWAPRDVECEALTQWANEEDAPSVCAVLGEEGAGKTWLLFDWWHRQVQRDQARLFVWLAARDVTSGSLAETLAAALAKWMPLPGRAAMFWTTRVHRWRQAALASTKDGPFLWLMLDGTNEGTSQVLVKKLLTEAADSDWKGAVRIVLTDRPSHWQSGLQAGQFLDPRPATVTLSHFQDHELDTLLTKHRKTRASFAPHVLSLIKWPSWFAVASAMFDQEYDWTAHSPEQLMLRYVQHRLSARLNAPVMEDAVFREFLSELGAEIQRNWDTSATYSRADLKARLSGFKGEPEKDILQAIDEVTSGVWFRRTGSHQFEVDKAVLPLAVGLALHRELRSLTTEEEVDASVERFLGPMEDQSLGVNILAAAIALTFLDATYPALSTRVLLRRWILSHNFSNAHFQHLWRIGSVDPAPLFDVAESVWMRREGGSAVDEILIKSIANVGGDGGKQPEVVAFLAKWARTYWPDPREGQFIGYRPEPAQRAQAAAATQQRLQRIEGEIGSKALAELDLIRVDDGTSASWTFYRVNSIATYLPRAAQASVWLGWTLSRAVMGRANHLDDMAWSLRVNLVDAADATPIFLETIDRLLTLPSVEIRKMTFSLLEAHGSRASLSKLISMGRSLEPDHGSWVGEASLVDGIVTLSSDDPASEIHTISLLSRFAFNPEADVAPRHVKLLNRYAKSFPVDKIGDGRNRTSASLDLELAMPALARWAPKALVALHRRFLLSVSNRGEAHLLGFSFSLQHLLILLTPPIQKKIRAALIQRRKARVACDLDDIDHALMTAALFGLAPRDQIGLWDELGFLKAIRTDLHHVLRAPSPAQTKALGNRLALDRPLDQMSPWLVYLALSAPKELPPRWAVLAKLFDHENPIIRENAFWIALNGRDSFLAKEHEQSEWAASAERPFRENWAGASLLATRVTPDTFNVIAGRVGPEWSSIVWRAVNYRPDCSDAFEAYLREAVARELNPPASRTMAGYRISRVTAVKKLIDQKPTEVAALADRLFSPEGDPAFARYEFPRMDLMLAYIDRDPDRGVWYWRKLSQSDSIFKPGEDVEEALFEVQDGEKVDALRRQRIMGANNDWKLLTLATFIIRHKRIPWAITLIKALLGNPEAPGDIARAVMLAGFLDDSPAVRALWKRELASAPLQGWIEEVYQRAKDNIQKTRMCLSWLDVSLNAVDDETFFMAWTLFAHLCERNAAAIAAQRLTARLKTRPQRQRDYVALGWEKLSEDLRKKERDLKDKLFAIRIGHQLARPWVDS